MTKTTWMMVAAIALAIGGCESNGAGLKGETCQMRSHCAKGLACINNTCVLDEFNIAASAQGCDYVECFAPQDCVNNNALCVTYQEDCDAGDQFACNSFDAACTFQCDSQRCVQPQCTDDAECFGGFCVDAQCVQCRNNQHCNGDDICLDGFCGGGCQDDFDCPLFDTCTGGACIDGDCSADRECVALTGNVESICAEGACTAPCESDADCDQANQYNFISCIDAQCTYVGCESDAECRAVAFGAGAVPDSVIDIACVDDPVNPNPPFGFFP